MKGNIDLFDRFIFGSLKPTGPEDFRQRLKEDERLAFISESTHVSSLRSVTVVDAKDIKKQGLHEKCNPCFLRKMIFLRDDDLEGTIQTAGEDDIKP